MGSFDHELFNQHYDNEVDFVEVKGQEDDKPIDKSTFPSSSTEARWKRVLMPLAESLIRIKLVLDVVVLIANNCDGCQPFTQPTKRLILSGFCRCLPRSVLGLGSAPFFGQTRFRLYALLIVIAGLPDAAVKAHRAGVRPFSPERSSVRHPGETFGENEPFLCFQ